MNRRLKVYSCVISLALVFVALFVSCAANKNGKENNVRILEMHSIFPMAVYQENIYYDTSIITLATADSFILYTIPVRRNNSVIRRDKEGNVVGDTLIALPSSPRYFFYHKGDVRGTFYDTTQSPNVWTYAVDSFLRGRSVTSFERNLNRMIETDSLVASITNSEDKSVIDKYVPKVKPEGGYDSLLVTFSQKIKNTDFSFSRRQDSIRASKITRVELKFNPMPNAPRPELRVSRRAVIAVKEGRNENPEALATLVKKMDSLRLKYIFNAANN